MNGFHTLMYHEIIDREGYDRQQYKGIKVKQDYHGKRQIAPTFDLAGA